VIVTNLHQEPTALDTVLHRGLHLDQTRNAIGKLAPFTSFMLTVGEFGEAAHDFPILFVRGAPDTKGKDTVAPVAVFGLKPGENLFLDGSKWTGSYVPAILRAYPFTMARIEGSERWALVFDAKWEGMSQGGAGSPLFDGQGQATELLEGIHKFVQEVETDLARTELACASLLEMNLLKPMRFDATLNDGEKLSVDGFMTIDEQALRALPDATLGTLVRNGLFQLAQVHLLSLNNMRRLADRRVLRRNGDTGPATNVIA
jgi:hypothetical protein